ncbi:hypothetical protein HGRIS_014838 [Hohenbuehelia grisea]|uniref:Uncharacterized protein n=1 Tax=Hohenbuehelia grisea TaxID=104357 RepID=A0ABR3IR06_9AGAR
MPNDGEDGGDEMIEALDLIRCLIQELLPEKAVQFETLPRLSEAGRSLQQRPRHQLRKVTEISKPASTIDVARDVLSNWSQMWEMLASATPSAIREDSQSFVFDRSKHLTFEPSRYSHPCPALDMNLIFMTSSWNSARRGPLPVARSPEPAEDQELSDDFTFSSPLHGIRPVSHQQPLPVRRQR